MDRKISYTRGIEVTRINNGSIENSLFTWDGWDGDHECMVFYEVELTRDIGEFKKGTKFNSAIIEPPYSRVTFSNWYTDARGDTHDTEIGQFGLKYEVEEFKPSWAK